MLGSHSLYPVLTWVTLFWLLSLGIKKIKKIMLPMLKLDTNYGFHELFLTYSIHLVNYNVLWTEQNLEANSV
jgi:hypothetical protein